MRTAAVTSNIHDLPARRNGGQSSKSSPGERKPGNYANVVCTLRDDQELQGLVRFNEFANRVELGVRPPWRKHGAIGAQWSDDDDTALCVWLDNHGLNVRGKAVVAESVQHIARDYRYHPVRDHLNRLTWDGEPRLQCWLVEYLEANGSPDYLSAIGSKFLVSAVARIMRPGCQVDCVLVLEGPQGCGKTSTVRILGDPWVTDSMPPSLVGADAAIQLAGVWLVELAELSSMRRSEIETVKGYLSRTTDRYRPPYGRHAIERPRECVFLGTTNEAFYLKDPTGNRRFWPVRCGAINLPALERDRDQLWAEAVQRFNAGAAWHLSAEEGVLTEREQAERVHVSELEQAVVEYLERLGGRGSSETSMRDVLVDALGLELPRDLERAGKFGAQVAHILVRHGWQRVGTVGRYPNRRVVYRKTENSQGLAGVKLCVPLTRARIDVEGFPVNEGVNPCELG